MHSPWAVSKQEATARSGMGGAVEFDNKTGVGQVAAAGHGVDRHAGPGGTDGAGAIAGPGIDEPQAVGILLQNVSFLVGAARALALRNGGRKRHLAPDVAAADGIGYPGQAVRQA